MKKLKEIKEKLKRLKNLKQDIEDKELEKDRLDKIINERKFIIDKETKKIEQLTSEIEGLKKFITSNKVLHQGPLVDITDVYILGKDGKKYIALRKTECKTELLSKYENTDTYTYKFYDIFNRTNNKYIYKYCELKSHSGKYTKTLDSPRYVRHILQTCPELLVFVDNKVPLNYLKKIYYELNGISSEIINEVIEDSSKVIYLEDRKKVLRPNFK